MPQPHPNDDRGELLRVIIDALSYADLGLRVVPLGQNSKTPMLERWRERATTDPETIIRWFSSWPNANLGIVAGRGVFAVDLDPRHQGDVNWKKFVGRRKLPWTAKALTGSGGTHLIFRVDPGLRIPSKIGFLPGVDIIGEDSVLVVEPSTHPRTRKEYVWLVRLDHCIAEAPAWLVRRITAARPAGHAKAKRPLRCSRRDDEQRLLDQVIERFPVKACGQRNAQMARAVGSLLGREYAPELVQRILSDWHDHFFAFGLTSTSREQAVREVAACIKSTLRNPEFSPAVSGTSHREKIARIELGPEAEVLIADGHTGDGRSLTREPTDPPHGTTITSKDDRLCRTAQERAFVRAFTVLMVYKVKRRRENPPKATHQQLAELIERRSGLKLGCVQFERLFRKYITRPGKPAVRFELAIQTVTGRPGIPSEFQLTGVRLLMAGPDGKLDLSENTIADASDVSRLCSCSPEGMMEPPPSVTVSSSSNAICLPICPAAS